MSTATLGLPVARTDRTWETMGTRGDGRVCLFSPRPIKPENKAFYRQKEKRKLRRQKLPYIVQRETDGLCRRPKAYAFQIQAYTSSKCRDRGLSKTGPNTYIHIQRITVNYVASIHAKATRTAFDAEGNRRALCSAHSHQFGVIIFYQFFMMESSAPNVKVTYRYKDNVRKRCASLVLFFPSTSLCAFVAGKYFRRLNLMAMEIEKLHGQLV